MNQPATTTTKIININRVKTMCQKCSGLFPVQDFAEHVKSCNPILQKSAPTSNTSTPISNSTSTATSKSRHNIPRKDRSGSKISPLLADFKISSPLSPTYHTAGQKI